jgi:hypothetical protein
MPGNVGREPLGREVRRSGNEIPPEMPPEESEGYIK